MRVFKFIFAALLITLFCSRAVFAQSSSPAIAPVGDELERVWHLGRVTGDLERIIQFYHDLLGLDLRGERNADIPFYSVDSINEFVNTPVGTEFRAAFMPIPGTSKETAAADQIYLEAFEFRDIERHQFIPPLSDLGVSNLTFLVADLDGTLAQAKESGVSIITPGGEPVSVPAPAGLSGAARAIMLRDPDGYAVELIEISPAFQHYAPADSRIVGAHMSVVVEDINVSLSFYREFIGSNLQIWEVSDWQNNENFSQLRNISVSDYRTAAMLLPGTSIVLELIEFRGIEQELYRPVFQDIGFGHVAFMVNNIEVIFDRMNALGAESLSESGTWTDINPGTRAIYTRDPDGFFIEIIELQ